MTATPPPPLDALALRRFVHELNAQLGVAVLAISVQQEQLDALADPAQAASALQDLREGSQLVRASLERSLQLVARTLRRPPSENPWDGPPQPLATLARQALAEQLRQRTGLQVELTLALPPAWSGDALAWHQVLSNLISNSVVHGFAGRQAGAIRITGQQHAEGPATIDYQDDGVGVDPAHVARLFDNGFSTRHGHGGHGLGLGIVRQLLQQHLNASIDYLPQRERHGAHFRIRWQPAGGTPTPPASSPTTEGVLACNATR
jgi:signal transduction histidine kinase